MTRRQASSRAPLHSISMPTTASADRSGSQSHNLAIPLSSSTVEAQAATVSRLNTGVVCWRYSNEAASLAAAGCASCGAHLAGVDLRIAGAHTFGLSASCYQESVSAANLLHGGLTWEMLEKRRRRVVGRVRSCDCPASMRCLLHACRHRRGCLLKFHKAGRDEHGTSTLPAGEQTGKEFHLGRKAQGAQRLRRRGGRRRDVDKHERLGVAAQRRLRCIS